MFTTIPTIMTWTRIFAIPLIVGIFYLPDSMASQGEKNLIATVMFILFAATDWLDGFLARRLNQTSSFGAFLDPVADKFLVCACVLILVHLQRADVFVALIIIGKLKTVAQMVAIPFLLFDGVLFGVVNTHQWGVFLIWVAAVLTVWSMVYYLQKALPEIRARVR